MAKTFTRLGKQIAIAVKAGGPEPENNPTLRSVIATCKRENSGPLSVALAGPSQSPWRAPALPEESLACPA